MPPPPTNIRMPYRTSIQTQWERVQPCHKRCVGKEGSRRSISSGGGGLARAPGHAAGAVGRAGDSTASREGCVRTGEGGTHPASATWRLRERGYSVGMPQSVGRGCLHLVYCLPVTSRSNSAPNSQACERSVQAERKQTNLFH